MGTASSKEETRQWLLVLGNAGSRRALPALARFARHPSARLRAAAVGGLRWVNASGVDALLARTLTSDRHPAVRLEAATVLGDRPLTAATFQAQRRTVRKDAAVAVRLAALRNLWAARAAYPEAHRLVQATAKQDGAKEVRKAALQLLATG
jgi:hypothetical protein